MSDNAEVAVNDKQDETMDEPSDLPLGSDEPIEDEDQEMESNIKSKHEYKTKKKANQIKIDWPKVIDLQQYERRKHYPESYYTNTKKENVLIWLANKFGELCSQKNPEQRPIILIAENECKIPKMVCTTIRPTKIRYPEFYSWQGCAQFIAHHVEYEPLKKPVIFPQFIVSPDTVLQRQKGNSFEMAIVLVSCLIGSGYDAYVVSGYSTREICANDQTRVKCPDIMEEKRKEEQKVEKDLKKYTPKPPHDFSSQFLKMMKEREENKIEEAKRKLYEEEKKRILEFEKPPSDEIFGLRRHSWVLILPGSRDVQEPFFIESATGTGVPTDSSQYLGVDSIWNSNNYWVSLQNDRNLNFDLENRKEWRQFIEENALKEYMEEDENHNLDYNDTILVKKHMDVLKSWVKQLKIPYRNYQQRYPHGCKQTFYHKTKNQLYAPYVQENGLIHQITKYNDYDYKDEVFKSEVFKNRKDCMHKIETDSKNGTVIEYFIKGREDSLEQYRYQKSCSIWPENFTLQFYHSACFNGLYKVTIQSNTMTEEYLDREDFLHLKHCQFEEVGDSDLRMKTITKVKEIFDKIPHDEPDKCIAMREFDMKKNKIHIRYHHSNGKLIANSKTFQKIPSKENNGAQTFHPELLTRCEFDSLMKTSHDDLPALFEELIRDERRTKMNTQILLDKVHDFLVTREEEKASPKLKVSIYDSLRNERMYQEMKKKEYRDEVRARDEIEGELDYFLPYFETNENRKIDKNEAENLRKKCLSDFKTMQQNRTSVLQNRIKQLIEILEKKENEQEKILISGDEGMDIISSEVKHIKSRLHIMELRLDRHKKLSAERYHQLVEKLNQDLRLKVSDSN